MAHDVTKQAGSVRLPACSCRRATGGCVDHGRNSSRSSEVALYYARFLKCEKDELYRELGTNPDFAPVATVPAHEA